MRVFRLGTVQPCGRSLWWLFQAAAVWALGQLGKHDADHANALAQQDILRLLQDTLLHEESSDGGHGLHAMGVRVFSAVCATSVRALADLRQKAKRALKAVGGQCTLLPAMQALLSTAPGPVLLIYLTQFAKVWIVALLPRCPHH